MGATLLLAFSAFFGVLGLPLQVAKGGVTFGGGASFNSPASAAPASAVAIWLMHEGSGSTFLDSSGNGNNQTIGAGCGSWGTVSGLGTAFTFNGTCDPASSGSNATYTNFSNTDPFSVSLWVSLPSVTAKQVFASSFTTPNYKGWEVDLQAGGTLGFYLINNIGTNEIAVFSTAGITASAVHFLVFTYSGSSAASGVSMYIDGSPVGKTTSVDNLTATASGGHVVVFGNRIPGLSNFPLNGAMAYVRIFNHALSSSDVTTMYAAGPS